MLTFIFFLCYHVLFASMIPLFKSHFSIGRSILTLSPPAEDSLSADSIFDICVENKLDKVVLVEDSLTGFLEALKNSSLLGIQLIFGLRLSICDDMFNEKSNNEHKVIIFCKNPEGYKNLTKIYSKAFAEGFGKIDFKNLKILWEEDSLLLFVPFYDSFIFKNNLTFSNCVPNFSFLNPTFFIEDNDLPFDSLIEKKIIDFCKANNYNTETAKSIYYRNKTDFEAFQTYKCICSRKFGRSISLSKPNLEHCGSRAFSFQSFLEKQNEIA